MRFHKNIPQEHRDFLREQLKQYEKEMTMTDEERRELHKWVASGHSPYENGDYVCNESGYPMDFVSTMRFWDEQMEWFNSLSEEEQEELRNPTVIYNTETDEVMMVGVSSDWADEELPFQ